MRIRAQVIKQSVTISHRYSLAVSLSTTAAACKRHCRNMQYPPQSVSHGHDYVPLSGSKSAVRVCVLADQQKTMQSSREVCTCPCKKRGVGRCIPTLPECALEPLQYHNPHNPEHIFLTCKCMYPCSGLGAGQPSQFVFG